MKPQSTKPGTKAADAERKPSAGEKRNAGAFVAGDPRINRTKPGPGRPTDRFKKWCRKQVGSAVTKKAVRRILKNPNHPAFKAMWSTLAEHGHGKPDAHLDVKASVTLEQLVAAANQPPGK
jgi:hypothetical protein